MTIEHERTTPDDHSDDDTVEDLDQTDDEVDTDTEDDVDVKPAEEVDETADVEDIDTSHADADEDFGETADVNEAEAGVAEGYFERTDATGAADETDVLDEVEAPVETSVAAESTPAAFDGDGPFLADAASLQQRWDGIQIGFVDEPLQAVENAGDLVAEVLEELANSLAARRNEIESQWRDASDVSTEDLRVVFQAYRTFFRRIVV